MSEQKGNGSGAELLRTVLSGILGAAVLALLLFCGAVLSDSAALLRTHPRGTALLCLWLAAVCAGLAGCRNVRCSRFPKALLSECVLLSVAAILCIKEKGTVLSWSFFTDVIVLCFGALAGSLPDLRRKRRRRSGR